MIFFAASLGKLRGAASSNSTRTHLGVSPGLWKLIGILELAGVAGLFAGFVVHPLAEAAAGGLALLSLGALASHLRMRDPLSAALPAVLGLVFAAASFGLLLV